MNYNTAEEKMISVVHCIKKYRSFIIGNPLTIITDNKSIMYINNCKRLNARMTRWVLLIQEYITT